MMELLISRLDGKEYSLTCSNFEFCEGIFESYEIVPSGHVWTDVILSYCEENNVDLDDVEFDSESDMFAAYAEDEGKLTFIRTVFEKIAGDSELLSKLLEEYEDADSGIWPIKEFLDHLQLNRINLEKPLFLHFHIEFESVQKSKAASKDAVDAGYSCYLGREYETYPVAACVTTKPTVNALEQAIAFFSGLALKHDGKFEYYDFEAGDFFEELDHWVVFENDEIKT